MCGLLSQLPVTSLFHLVCPRSGDDNEAYQLFRPRANELETIVGKVRLPNVVKVNGSKYSKLGSVLNTLPRFGTAAQNHHRKKLFGLHAKLHRATSQTFETCSQSIVQTWQKTRTPSLRR